MVPRFLGLLLLVSLPFFAFAQLEVSYPMPRLVVQRGADGNGRIYISGRLTGAVDRVEAQLTPVAAGQGTDTGWQTIQTNPTNNLFLGSITASGGWYTLTVRSIVGSTTVAQAVVDPVGIGEVFITAGQSNSRGLGIGDNDLGTATGRVMSIDSINHSYPPGAQALVSVGDPFPVPVFKPLTAGHRIFPMAESSWGWGELGDYIVNRYNVPVAYYVTGWDGSTIDNWLKSANGTPTCNAYYCVENWPYLQPYTNLKNVLQYYASMAGVRAVLWHQGEAEGDVARNEIPQYAERLRALIQKTRQDFGNRSMPWVIARASFNGQVTTPAVVAQQEAVIATANFNVFQGPFNDTIQNRNANTVDVHFRNSARPSPHPRYYLNPASIPVDMGLSRFARNWNNSLNDAFFQNAQPITPTHFAVTGNVAESIAPGSTIDVPFSTLGAFAGDNQWQVQLLDVSGQFKAVLGSGPTSPVRVTLPAAYQSGQFRIRVVATSPALPAVPSNPFRITNQPPASADLSLAMTVSERSPSVNEPITITLLVRNEGSSTVNNVVVRNRLPNNLAVLSTSGLVQNNGVLTGTVDNVAPGGIAALSFVARPTVAGVYRNAAEISQASATDVDSQPGSGTGDGQDDAAEVDFRTLELSGALFVSPNPDQVPLPPVSSNQPAPDPNKADVSVQLAVSNRTPAVNEVITYSITITNMGGLPATGLSVTAYLPAGQTFVPGDDLALSGGNIVGGVSSLDAGGSVTLRLKAVAVVSGRGISAVQISGAGRPDPDSTPNNGLDNGEDDTAQVDVRVK
ncbi:hypothetical protein GCM10027341_25170 [Spirosoma knui]